MKCLFIHAGSEFQFYRACTYSQFENLHAYFIVPEEKITEFQSRCNDFSCIKGLKALCFDKNGIDFDKHLVAFIKKHNFEKIYIISPGPKAMRYVENEQSLNLNSIYNIFRAVHRLGIKDVSFINSNQILDRHIDSLLDDYTGFGEGKRCFVVGNGPSLNQVDMTLLKDEITFGCNRGYLGFEQWGIEFDFWAVIDRIQIEHHMGEWEMSIPETSVKLFPFEYSPLCNLENVCPVNFKYNVQGFPQFSDDPGVVYLGFTTVHFLLQIAVIMGFKDIIMIGVDNSYNIPDGAIINDRWTDKNSLNHFHKDYCENGTRLFVPPRLEKSDMAYKYASDWCSKNNVRVLNASPGSKLKDFPMVDFNELF